MKKAVVLLLVWMLMGAGLVAGDAGQKAYASPGAQEEEEWDWLFTYDAAAALPWTVKAAIPGEEEAYWYPWGSYDALEEGEREPEAQKVQEGRKASQVPREVPQPPRAADPQGMAEPEGMPQPPADWNAPSNQPALGGRLEFASGGATVLLEMSEYCISADTVFTVTPVKDSVLPREFFQGGFALTGPSGEPYVTLGDDAIVTFLTREDPGEEVVIKSLSPEHGLEYTRAEVVRLGDTYRITGTVEHFSTVGYGNPTLSSQGEAELEAYGKAVDQRLRSLLEKLREKARQEAQKTFEQKAREEYGSRKHLQTVEFDEILFTTSATGNPLQLHLRAKLVDQPYQTDPKTGKPEHYLAGKVWLKFYTWMPEGYGVIYMVCNNAQVPYFYGPAHSDPGAPPAVHATLTMASFSGSASVAHGVGSFDISGKSYTDVDTVWQIDPKTDRVQVTFTSMKGAAEKTFITGRLAEKTLRQAGKPLKWFLE